jgi:succinate dehydrogenase / fumarate reductase, cytochrome b subunit
MSTQSASLKNTLTGYSKYKGREGQNSFLLHRLTGIGTLLFLLIHIVETATIYFYPSLYNHAIALYRLTPFMIGEVFLVFSVIFHGVNGLRIAYVDLVAPQNWTIAKQRVAAKVTFIVSVILWIAPAYIMIRKLLHHNFGIG